MDQEDSDNSFTSPAYSPVSREKLEESLNNINSENGIKMELDDKKIKEDSKSPKNDDEPEPLSPPESSAKRNIKKTPVKSVNNKPHLPEGWTYKKIMRKKGTPIGKIEFYIFSPEGQKFRTLTELKQFINKTLKYQHLHVDDYDFFKIRTDKMKTTPKNKINSPNKKDQTTPKRTLKMKKLKKSTEIKKFSPRVKRKIIDKNNPSPCIINNKKPKKPAKIKKERIFPKSQSWTPPKSPYELIQETLFHEPWQLLIATIFLNCTKGDIALPIIDKFLKKWPFPRELLKTDLEEITEFIKPIGFEEKRAYQIKRFTDDYLNKRWKYPKELFGIGKYGNDSYRIFCINEWKMVRPHDLRLTMYVNWLWTNHQYLDID